MEGGRHFPINSRGSPNMNFGERARKSRRLRSGRRRADMVCYYVVLAAVSFLLLALDTSAADLSERMYHWVCAMWKEAWLLLPTFAMLRAGAAAGRSMRCRSLNKIFFHPSSSSPSSSSSITNRFPYHELETLFLSFFM